MGKETKITKIINNFEDSLDNISEDESVLNSPILYQKKQNHKPNAVNNSVKQVPKLNFCKVTEKYNNPSNNVEGLYKYEEKGDDHVIVIDKFLRFEIQKQDNYKKLKSQVKRSTYSR